MFKLLVKNINGKHQKKKMNIQNDDEYFEFMIKDFNMRIEIALWFGLVVGAIMGTAMTYVLLTR